MHSYSWFFLVAFFIFSLAFALTPQKRNIVYIYNDEGVSVESFNQTKKTFSRILPPFYKVRSLSADEVREKHWQDNAALLIMPGGADLPYVKKLSGKGIANIRSYVRKRGSYLGICAGAYFASREVEFDRNGPLEVIGPRDLVFFPGVSIGPIVPYEYGTNKGARAAKLTLRWPQQGYVSVFSNGGGYFHNAEQFSNVKIVATYPDQRAAIVYLPFGKGRVILSHVHFEYDPLLLDNSDPYLQPFLNQLLDQNPERIHLIRELLKLLQVKTAIK